MASSIGTGERPSRSPGGWPGSRSSASKVVVGMTRFTVAWTPLAAVVEVGSLVRSWSQMRSALTSPSVLSSGSACGALLEAAAAFSAFVRARMTNVACLRTLSRTAVSRRSEPPTCSTPCPSPVSVTETKPFMRVFRRRSARGICVSSSAIRAVMRLSAASVRICPLTCSRASST
ncbi:hypothetical protein ACFPRL_24750 [Pseudoclavibacter helvolus]